MTEFGKENTSVTTGRTKPMLVNIGGKTVNAGGRWNNDLMADLVMAEAQSDWIKVGELARIGCGSNTKANKTRVRSRLSQLFTKFVERGKFLAIKYGGGHHSATAVKVADVNNPDELQLVEAKLEKMRKRKEMTLETYDRSKALLYSMVEINDG